MKGKTLLIIGIVWPTVLWCIGLVAAFYDEGFGIEINLPLGFVESLWTVFGTVLFLGWLPCIAIGIYRIFRDRTAFIDNPALNS